MIRWYVTALACLFFMMRPSAPLSVYVFFGGLLLLAVYRLGGDRLLRMVPMRARRRRRMAAEAREANNRG
ncbi:hypothetical protein EA656_02535 [Pseudoxanthomonas winnipegensis]|uniref:Uncharacterized protein n=1 Tax=Pseudoxanthomonas winnipegensis TaxID=2480810 RepID=A0A4Q8M0N5_9GAMM|nr:hypothetical protein [Pseudoxanthomonas winnipegensis]TAA37564.1 hypothetical protein EA656_02535 [Pseudoxanthomonas winnipegensis]